jgi:hypothetical protein
MSFNVGPRTISATGGSIKRVGNYRIHTFPSELVTDGLVLNLDAGDPRSYPGSGTSWTDLSGNGNTGTLTNGPTYNNANGGTLFLMELMIINIVGTLPLLSSANTVEFAVYTPGSNYQILTNSFYSYGESDRVYSKNGQILILCTGIYFKFLEYVFGYI